MQRDFALSTLSRVLTIRGCVNSTVRDFADSLATRECPRDYLRAIGEVMADLDVLLDPISAEFPDLRKSVLRLSSKVDPARHWGQIDPMQAIGRCPTTGAGMSLDIARKILAILECCHRQLYAILYDANCASIVEGDMLRALMDAWLVSLCVNVVRPILLRFPELGELPAPWKMRTMPNHRPEERNESENDDVRDV